MTPSAWQHRMLKRFRADAEACIPYPKGCFGLGCCPWSALPLPSPLQEHRASKCGTVHDRDGERSSEAGRGASERQGHGATVPSLRRTATRPSLSVWPKGWVS